MLDEIRAAYPGHTYHLFGVKLNALKEEIFALESDKIAGTITAAEYAELKAALDTVLKRALKRQ